MGSSQVSSDTSARSSAATAVAMRYEVTALPVADADRAKAFYQGLGWRLDADFPVDEHYRVVQFTPPGSPASIQFGVGLTAMTPGSMQDMMLVVENLDAARADLKRHGAQVSEVWHGRGLGSTGHLPGPDPDHTSYRSYASFTDPDGNRFVLQEITERLPGRV